MTLASLLVVTAAAIVAALGGAHVLFTFAGPKLLPRDPAVRPAMEGSPLVITRETSVWRAWIGFNASHGLGAVLFGAVYAYLALAHPALLFGSVPLLLIGTLTLLAYLVLARRYFFSTPLHGVAVALACWVAAVVVSRTG
jgi:hypothetical protein